jgi:hypothetical protein
VIEREKQARGFESIDDTPIGVDVWGVEVDAFMRGCLYNRVTRTRGKIVRFFGPR